MADARIWIRGKRASVVRISLAVLATLGAALVVLVVVASVGIWMPGHSHRGALPEASEAQQELARQLERDVRTLAGTIGERNTQRPSELLAARTFVRGELQAQGYDVREETWKQDGVECANLIAERVGALVPEEIVILGAHYDSVAHCPGADDNGSGVAALLALARLFADSTPERTLRFVAFANEEPPYFATRNMGSAHHARGCKDRAEQVVVMLSLETLGYYTDREVSQRYPAPGLERVYPSRGDFLALVGNFASRRRVREAVQAFRETVRFPCEGAALPDFLPGVGWSDQLPFWEHGYDALMATDTALFRNPSYHTAEDTPDSLDYDRFARVVEGLHGVAQTWCSARSR
jgi:hypothetical protein